MKNLAILFFCLAFYQFTSAQGVSVGSTTPDPSAMLDVSSTSKGMLVPRMSTAQRTTISSPATGLLVFDTNTNSFWFKGGSSWVELIDSSNTVVQTNGPDIYMGMSGDVGVGNSSPVNKLDVQAGSRTGTHPTGLPLYVTGDIGATSTGVEIRHNNSTQGIGIGFNTIYAAGTNPDQSLGLQSKGVNGHLLLTTNGVERMRITGNGAVGIGMTMPAASFDIARGAGGEGTLAVRGTSHHSHFNYGATEHTYIRGGKAGSHIFLNDQSGQGNVSIGVTTNPQNKLDLLADTRTGTHPSGLPLYVTGNIGEASTGVEIRRNNATQGVGIGYNTIYAAGSDTDQNLGIQAKGTAGNVLLKTNGAERMRVTGNGNVGIGVSNPDASLALARGVGNEGTLKIQGTSHPSYFNYSAAEHTYIRGGKAGSHVILNDEAPLGNVGIGTITPAHKLSVIGNTGISGNIAVGNGTAANAPLQFANGTQNRKIVLHEAANNDNQFFGFGIDGATMRYQVNNPADHVFWAGNTNSASVELMRIKGTGNVGIGTATPNAPLQFANTTANRKIVLYESANNDHEFYGLGINGGTLRYQVPNTTNNHVFYAGTSVTTSDTLICIKGDGNVNVPGNMNVSTNLDVNGTVYMGWQNAWSAAVNVGPQTAGTVTCNCPTGTTALGGGGQTNNDGMFMIESYESTATSWTVRYWNSNLVTTATAQAFVQCARIGN